LPFVPKFGQTCRLVTLRFCVFYLRFEFLCSLFLVLYLVVDLFDPVLDLVDSILALTEAGETVP